MLYKSEALALIAASAIAAPAAAQQSFTPTEVACERGRAEYCASTLYADAPNSSRATSLICAPGEFDGTPDLTALVRQTGSAAETRFEVALGPSTRFSRNLTAPQSPGATIGRGPGGLVASGAENATYVFGNPGGASPRNLASNVTNGLTGTSLEGTVLGSLTTTCTTNYTAKDMIAADLFRDTVRFEACGGTSCSNGGTYETSVGEWREINPGTWGYKAFVNEDLNGAFTRVGDFTGQVKATLDANNRPQDGMVTISSWNLPTGVTAETEIYKPGATLEKKIGVSTRGPTSSTFNWQTDVFETGPCVPSDTVACIDQHAGDKRFKIEMSYKVNASDPYSVAHVKPLSDVGVNKGAIFWFFNPANPELLIKMIDASGPPFNHFWAFYGGGTNVGTVVKVTDTFSGLSKEYTNAASHALLPVQDTTAFTPDGTPGPPYTPTEVSFDYANNLTQSSVNPYTCVPSDTVTCIGGRFEVKIDYFTTQGGGDGLPHPARGISLAPIGVDRGSIYSFFNTTNPEVLVKVLNACVEPFNKHWVFFSAVTNVGYDLTVTDTVAGIRNVYHNNDRSPAPPVQHTAAFPCP
jgi:hypothetical protein